MVSKIHSSISRRGLLLAGSGAVLHELLPSRSAFAADDLWLVAAPARASLLDDRGLATDVWAYNGAVPGPIVRLRQGERARIRVANHLSEDTTVHWHGIRLPNAMDGVPGLTQAPITPGESFVYEFTPPDAGTFWYHPHADSLQQMGRGLAGPLIVEEPQPLAVDRDVLWFLSDWQLTREGKVAGGFPNRMQAAMAGRIGNVVTLNGRAHAEQAVRAGERVRLRVVNGAVARIMALRFDGHRPIVVALDGQPCDPHEPDGGQLVLGPAMRADLLVDMRGEPGRRYAVIDDFYEDESYHLATLVYDERVAPGDHAGTEPPVLARNPVPQPDLAQAQRHELVLEGGMMGRRGMMGMMRGSGASWSINGMAMTGDGKPDMPPGLSVRRGRSVVLKLRNDTAWWHPMHLHGHSFSLLTRNGKTVPHRQWRDTVLLAPDDTVEIAFVADNPGDWMFHCHVIDHQMTGLMTVIRVS